MIDLLRSIADNLDLDWDQFAVIGIAASLITFIVGLLVYVKFGVWRLAHPQAPWWTWMF